jgi:hypothetical protein
MVEKWWSGRIVSQRSSSTTEESARGLPKEKGTDNNTETRRKTRRTTGSFSAVSTPSFAVQYFLEKEKSVRFSIPPDSEFSIRKIIKCLQSYLILSMF